MPAGRDQGVSCSLISPLSFLNVNKPGCVPPLVRGEGEAILGFEEEQYCRWCYVAAKSLLQCYCYSVDATDLMYVSSAHAHLGGQVHAQHVPWRAAHGRTEALPLGW